jgi:non-ribosomal peptide synthase protein (TIGR01720 family)
MEGHGREDVIDGVDLSRTVGWFTTLFPVALDVVDGDWREQIKAVRRQLRAIPNNGFGFGALRYLGRLTVGGPDPQVSFNYLGQWDSRSTDHGHGGPGVRGCLCTPGPTGCGCPAKHSLYHAMHGSIGQDHSPADRGGHLLDIVGEVGDGQLGFTWYFRPDECDPAVVESVAGEFAAALRGIAEDCRGAA